VKYVAPPPPTRLPYRSAACGTIEVLVLPENRWNHNLHYHPLILGAVPEGCQQALDVGCGEGTLARELRRIVPDVSAIDPDRPSILLARQQDDGAGIAYLVGDFLTYPFEPASFDLIASVAALHHMDACAAFTRMRDLLRPGGRLAIIGLARSRYAADLPRDLAAGVAHRLHKATKGCWEISAPTVWPPPKSYAVVRHLVAEALPEARLRRQRRPGALLSPAGQAHTIQTVFEQGEITELGRIDVVVS
jgi:SAM-dependent methyltransferase